MFQLFARVQEYYERKFTVVIPSILCAALNLILNYIFIKLCGYQAAAYTTFFCYALFCFIHYLFYKKVCTEILNGTQLYDVKGLLAISAFGFSLIIEMLQLLLRLGTFQLSDIFYNTVGGVLGGLLYCVAMKARKHL